MLEKMQKRTLGAHVTEMKKGKLSTGVDESGRRVDRFVEERNWLAHRSWRENGFDVFSEPRLGACKGRVQAVADNIIATTAAETREPREAVSRGSVLTRRSTGLEAGCERSHDRGHERLRSRVEIEFGIVEEGGRRPPIHDGIFGVPSDPDRLALAVVGFRR